MKKFEGAFTALATPFKNNEIDKNSFARLVRFQISEGIDGLVVNGTTGESPTLDWEEVTMLFEIAKKEVDSKIPILIGTGANCTETTIKKSIAAANLGADGLLIVTPYYNKPPQRGLVSHYKAVASAVDIPIVLYNVPGRTAVNMSAEATAELSQIPNIVGVKDATADMVLGKKINELCGDEFLLISGDDFTFVDLAMLGGRGVISVLSNILPKKTAELIRGGINKDDNAKAEIAKLKKITELLFAEANPIPVKSALCMMGIIDTEEMRLPLVPIDPKIKNELKTEMKSLGLIK